MRKYVKISTFILLAALMITGCSKSQSEQTASSGNMNSEQTRVDEADKENISIILSDDEITVNGSSASTDSSEAVYVGADIVYYEEGKDETYGEGSDKDAHSKAEAAEHTVLTITKPGTYEVSGSISKGQISIDLGEESEDDPDAVVNLILNNAEITCTVAPSIVVYNAYECGSDDEEDATPSVDTSNAGFNLILAKNSDNVISGSYVAKIYKDGTTKEDVENGDAKKKYKFDAAIDSLVSFNISSGENGKLTVNAENEGISSGLHMTVKSGEIRINASDDSINTNEDNVSVFTLNGGTVICNSGLGTEGDGIDSNGYIVINDGFVIACANGSSQDSGLDSDKGIYINGGTVLGTGNMYDEISDQSTQKFMVFMLDETIKENQLIMLTDEEENPITAFYAFNDYSIAVYSSPELSEESGKAYKVASVEGDLKENVYFNITGFEDMEPLSSSSRDVIGKPGMGGPGPEPGDGEMKEHPEGERPELPEGERPKSPEFQKDL
ncbi:MAG: carbohydrate-binding domain-containing protein [Bacillota bacterium]|nr:carbohydrate-binding domain-containing protein [Bacillota bacterium]